MTSDNLNEEMRIFRDSAIRFFKEIIYPNSPKWRKKGIVDREAFRKAGDMGFLCMWADEAYGGLGIKDFRYEKILVEENAKHGDPGYFITLHSRLVGPYIDRFGNEEQKKRLLPGMISGEIILAIAMTEPDAGSDLSSMKSRATKKGDRWILNGSKTYISNGINADVVIVAAKTDKENPHAMTLFLVERDMPGFSRGENLKKMGLKSQDTAELFFDDVEIPEANVLGKINGGFYHLMQGLPEERLIAACGNIVSAKIALDITTEFVKQRKVFGKPLSKMQNTRFKLAALDADLRIGQVYVDHCVELLNCKRLTAADAARAKLFTSELNGRMVDECLQLHGGAGYMEEYKICQLYQDERVHRILAGTSEIMKEIIARDLLD